MTTFWFRSRAPARLSWLLMFTAACQAHAPLPAAAPAEAGSVLPLRRVRLFENGVGYFERAGKIEDAAAVLPVPASHVDDALKTLVVLSDHGTKVGGVEFGSVVSGGTARSLAGLRLGDETPLGFDDVLKSLEGYRVKVVMKSASTLTGRLMNVLRFDRALPGKPPENMDVQASTEASEEEGKKKAKPSLGSVEDFWLFVVGDDGSLRRLALSELTSLVPLDAGFSSRLQTAADALSGRAAQLARNLRVLASGGSPLRLGYVAEAPVWRSSYRLVLDPARDSAMVQGWALIHNDTDEAWANVSVELVNGRPDSFLFPMTAPRYTRRPMATPDEELSTVAQLALKTPDAIWGDHADEEAGGLGLTGVGEGGGGFGEGFGTIGHGAGIRIEKTEASDSISIGDLASVAKARGENEGVLFSYRLEDAVSLRAHGSALLPFFASLLDAKRLTRIDAGSHGARAAIRLRNGSPNTLPAGPIAVFERQGFSGEAVLPRLQPGARVFLYYGSDLDTEIEEENAKEQRDIRKLTFEQGVLEEHYLRTRERKVALVNRSTARKTVAYALTETVNNARVTGADALDYDAGTSTPLALFELEPRARLERKVVIVEAMQDRARVSELQLETIDRALKAPVLDAAARSALTAAAVHVKGLELERVRLARLNGEISHIDEDLARYREHLKAAGSSGGPRADPLTRRIVELEAQRARARDDIDAVSARLQSLGDAAARELTGLNAAKWPE
jgi:hypothetical protein